MANFFKKLLDSLNVFTEDDDLDDEYDDYLLGKDEKGHRKLDREPKGTSSISRTEKKASTTTVPISSSRSTAKDDYDYSSSSNDKLRMQRNERTVNSKVVPIRTTSKGFEVCVMKPSSFEESQDICDVIISERACVINLEGFDVDIAQRVMDFVSGSIYALNGRLHQISSYIFIVSPETVDISGDYLDIIEQVKFGAPTINKGF